MSIDAEHARAERAASPEITGQAAAAAPAHPVPLALHAGEMVVGHAEDPMEQDADRRARRALARLAVVTGTRRDDGPVRRDDAPVRRTVALPRPAGEIGVDGGVLPVERSRAIERLRPYGRPLDEPVRRRMDAAFGASFSDVRVHDGADAARLSRSISAQAFTSGRDIVFGGGQYAPDTPEGERVLAHELAHVLQPDQYVRRTIGPDAQVGDRVIRVLDKQAFTVRSRTPDQGKAKAYRLDPGKVYVKANKKEYDLDTSTGSAPRHTLGTGAPTNVASVPTGVTTVSAPTLSSVAHDNLATFARVNVIDLGGPGSGHQASVVKLFQGLARVGYTGEVHLSYNARKTRIYLTAFGRRDDLTDAATSYQRYHEDWTAAYPPTATGEHQLSIRCHPIGGTGLRLTSPSEERVFGTLRTKWTSYAWPGLTPAAPTGAAPTQKFGRDAADYNLKKDWSVASSNLATRQEAFMKSVFATETGAGMAEVDDLPDLGPGAKTLTAFGAMDFHASDEAETKQPRFKEDYFKNHFLEKLKQMTGETEPVSIILQPFLWSAHPMNVLKGDAVVGDVTTKVTDAGGIPAYPWSPSPSTDDDAVISKQPDIAKAILTQARAGSISLVAAYYGGSVSKISYRDLLKVLYRLLQGRPGKFVVALIGDEDSAASKQAAEDLGSPGGLAASGPGDTALPDSDVVFSYIGRTGAMSLWQRYSKIFVTEGANTWQETLTLGVPTLSSNPTGNTKPWDVGPSGGEADVARELVRTASAALIAAGELVKAGKDPGDLGDLKGFLDDLLSPDSMIKRYFNAWKDTMAKEESDQVVAALSLLPK